MSMKELNVGVIGVGHLGQYHAQKYFSMENVNLVGVVDIDQDRAKSVAKKYNTKSYVNYKNIISKVDAVSIAVPTPSHFQVSRDLLENGVDVLIEKPMTTTLKEADKLIDIAESKDLIIQVGHIERFNPAVGALQDIINSPMFIEAHRLSVYKNRCTDVSVVLDLMIHDIDIILNIVKSKISTIHATGASVIAKHVDIANARIAFANGCVANVTTSRISMKNQRKIRIFQKDAYISVDFANRNITTVQKNDKDTTGIIPGMNIKKHCFSKGDALENELKSFIRSVRLREASEIPGQSGRNALQVALTIMDQINLPSNETEKNLS